MQLLKLKKENYFQLILIVENTRDTPINVCMYIYY